MSSDTSGKAMKSTRPVLRWHGGKWVLAPWIIDHFPPHRVYVEPFGGAASVLLQKDRSFSEVYNDLDEGAVNLFRILRSDDWRDLKILLEHTPFSRSEFMESYKLTTDPVESARRLIVRSFMGFGSDCHNADMSTGFRSCSNRSHTTPAHDWDHYPNVIPLMADRFRGVVIESRPAIKVIEQHDSPDTLHYLDPPYLPETRSLRSKRGKIRKHGYAHEMTEDDHDRLLEVIRGVKGKVILSGYPSEKYEAALSTWERRERVAFADGARKRTEVLWMNYDLPQQSLKF